METQQFADFQGFEACPFFVGRKRPPSRVDGFVFDNKTKIRNWQKDAAEKQRGGGGIKLLF
jgi:hypothetical protein